MITRKGPTSIFLASSMTASQHSLHSVRESRSTSNVSYFCACKNKKLCNCLFRSALAALRNTLVNVFEALFVSIQLIEREIDERLRDQRM